MNVPEVSVSFWREAADGGKLRLIVSLIRLVLSSDGVAWCSLMEEIEV